MVTKVPALIVVGVPDGTMRAGQLSLATTIRRSIDMDSTCDVKKARILTGLAPVYSPSQHSECVAAELSGVGKQFKLTEFNVGGLETLHKRQGLLSHDYPSC
tara:strand:- start:1768 stop:2073 length:306 start_codon:yes stop_codon:yes gene_type:complete